MPNNGITSVHRDDSVRVGETPVGKGVFTAVTDRTRPAVLQVERHLLGLIGALKQLDAGMESKVKAYIAAQFQAKEAKPKEPPKKKSK